MKTYSADTGVGEVLFEAESRGDMQGGRLAVEGRGSRK